MYTVVKYKKSVKLFLAEKFMLLKFAYYDIIISFLKEILYDNKINYLTIYIRGLITLNKISNVCITFSHSMLITS